MFAGTGLCVCVCLGVGGSAIGEAPFFSFLESYQKGAAKANSNEPG